MGGILLSFLGGRGRYLFPVGPLLGFQREQIRGEKNIAAGQLWIRKLYTSLSSTPTTDPHTGSVCMQELHGVCVSRLSPPGRSAQEGLGNRKMIFIGTL